MWAGSMAGRDKAWNGHADFPARFLSMTIMFGLLSDGWGWA